MLTKNEITALSLSPTKKDFVQIWNELLEVAGKLSERWDPTSTNESDPGIVILKALTGIADKLNYNIDKNTLEAFMPTAAQEDSMRKLCDMLGYTMKYYRSAETTVNIKYYNSDPSEEESEIMTAGLYIPKFTIITNSDKDINYFTTNKTPIFISSEWPAATEIPCMEGQIVKCDSINSNNVITVGQISENNRFYLPETQIAENGIFIYNVNSDYFEGDTLIDGVEWTRVDNLNIQARGARVFKFGYDSYESRPYVEFPSDYSELFNEGLFIYYTRTSGTNGNISVRTLTQVELPSTADWSKVSASSFSVENVFSATTGTNPETIKQAYNNFKKTIGTFETLVTCRDYMNKIYSLISSKTGKPLVSNILVTDIRNDLNRMVTICSCDNAGIFYNETPFVDKTVSTYTEVIGNETIVTKVIEKTPAIDHFDLVFYPFKSYNQIKSNVKDIKAVYDSSFTYASDKFNDITSILDAEGIKNIAHKIKTPRKGDLLSINNYLRLTATIATNSKVTDIERNLIVDNIKIALANAFNMRELDFGDEIPFDSIVEVIETADPRIRVASLNEPALYTTFSVLEDDAPNKPVIVEYAVASDWLDADMASTIGRFSKTEKYLDSEDGIYKTRTISTFNTKEAKQIYNDLAVRNVLAGRVPLFNYNNTFKPSFYESSYQVTTVLEEHAKPSILATPTKDNPFTLWVDSVNDIIYTGQLVYNEQDGTTSIIYTETKTPVEYDEVIKDNVVQETVKPELDDEEQDSTTGNTGSGSAGGTDSESTGGNTVSDYITNINTSCKLFADEYDTITDVTLADGEFVRFRAPNFTTVKTYPAYVNYRLDLDTALKSNAVAAEAITLFEALNSDIDTWSNTNQNINWQKALNYFETIDRVYNTSYKKTFTLKQLVCANKVADSNDISIQQGNLTTVIGINVTNTPSENVEYTAESLMTLSGCVKFTNSNFKARIEWTPQKDEGTPPSNAKLPELVLELGNPFITSVNVLADIQTKLDEALATYKTALFDKTIADDCLGHSFTVYLDFECVPFEAKSLTAWEKFVSTCALYYAKDYKYQIFDFKPVDENDAFLWRKTNTNSYNIGKAVTVDYNKLLKFNKNYFNSLDNIPLKGIYVIKNIGADAEPFIIKNNEEYKLRQNERLYIEYTPSTTTEEGSTAQQAAVTEIYSEGTIIRPSGFETGLLDSSAYAALGNSSHKQVIFTQVSNTPVSMFSFSASEQLEIRELAKVELAKDSFSSTSGIYIYKNFNGCPALEVLDTDANGERINNTYTLKDGEYIFYTDQNKSDFAYYTSGTQVTLLGKLTLPEFDVIELSTIFDSGLQEIPWKYKVLEANDRIVFQEFQYVTLGPGDTIKNLVLVDTSSDADSSGDTIDKYLSETWQYCADVKYTVANAPETQVSLAVVDMPDRPGNGWEASSTLELDVTPSSAQTLRSTDKVETSITLVRTSTDGGKAGEYTIMPVTSSTAVTTTSLPLSFKTNLACQACGNHIAVEDVYYNPDNLQGFQLKVFAVDAPVIVTTFPGTVAPYATSGMVDIATWTGEPLTTDNTSSQELWNKVNIDKIKAASEPEADGAFDSALRLPVSLLRDTYGLFCIYVDSTISATEVPDAKIWIEAIPGTAADSITILNSDGNTGLDSDNRLYLNHGINCIRVRKSCKIFIKASKESDGVVYFDEPRLVNSQKLEYVSATKEPVSLYTSGLNLTQLGYLDVSSNNGSKLDEAARAKLHAAYVDKASTELSSAVQVIDEEISDKYEALAKLSSKVQTLVDAENAINKELGVIRGLESDELKILVEKYNAIGKTLESEKALFEALENNVKADDIEQKLVALLNSMSTVSAVQQQILEELATLKAKAIASADSISGANLLADYVDYTAKDNVSDEQKTELNKIFTDIKRASTENVEKSYQEQLSVLIDNLAQLLEAADQNSLLTILTRLRATELSDERVALQALANRLNEALGQDSINNVLIEMDDAATFADYNRLYSLVNTLGSLIETRGLSVIAAEISQIVDEIGDSNITQLEELVDELKGLLNDTDEDTDSLSDQISTLAEVVKTKITEGDTSVDAGVVDKVANIRNAFSTDFTKNLRKIVDEISEIVAGITNDTSSVKELIKLLEDLESIQNDDSQLSIIIDSIKKAIASRETYLALLEKVSFDNENDENYWTNTEVKSFIYNAILTVWPASVSTRLSRLLNDIDTAFATAISGDLASFDSSYQDLQELFSVEASTNLTNTLSNALNTAAFTTLFKKVKSLLSASQQNANNIRLITTISSLVKNSDELTDALKDTGSNTIIETLISDWQATTDVIQKQKLQSSLKEELDKVIDVDEQLFSIITELLWPNISKIEADLDSEDSFYKTLFDELATIKKGILADEQVASNLVVDADCLSLLKLSLADFKEQLGSFKVPASSLLPDDTLSTLTTLKTTFANLTTDKNTIEKHPVSSIISSTELTSIINSIKNDSIKKVLEKFKDALDELETTDVIEAGYEDVFRILRLEEQLLADINRLDVNREFYYSVPVEDRLAIELNESDKKLNTLMNPLTNYDINNINNSFVISKLDIDYLDKGIQVARSSRLS